jgi:predicted  nucleic acid-binding Zn-ribbon protein
MTADRRAALLLMGFAEGNYMCRCTDCGLQFQGDKRSILCRECAEKALAHTDDKRAHSPFGNSENASRAALVEKVVEVINLARHRNEPSAQIATAAIALIRAEVLEEAANVADRYEIPLCETSASHIAAAIRALKAAP